MRVYQARQENKRTLSEGELTTLTYAEVKKLISGIPEYDEENSIEKKHEVPLSPDFLDLNFPARFGRRS